MFVHDVLFRHAGQDPHPEGFERADSAFAGMRLFWKPSVYGRTLIIEKTLAFIFGKSNLEYCFHID
jgi:hypothetical protein